MGHRNRKNGSKSAAPKGVEEPSPQVAPRDEDEVDEEVKEIFEEAQNLDYGSNDFLRKLVSYTDRSPILSGGDPDASWEYADIGEEAVGGENPTPDQSVVDEEGEAVGITYNDDEPLHTAEKLEQRDRKPWELNPASSADDKERSNEGHLALKRLIAEEGLELDQNTL